MKKVLLFLVLLFLFVPSSYALVGLGLGVRAGVVSNYDNPSLNALFDAPFVLKGKKIENMNMLGIHFKIGALPVIDLEVSGEYSWKTEEFSFEFRDYMDMADTASGEFKIEDYSLNATAKYVFSTPIVKPYVGAGGGLHIIRYSNPGPGPFFDTQTKPSYHACGGVLLDVPALPLDVFAEGRYTSIQTERKATGFFTWMLGVTLNLP
jgi:opacity protein-like surface antigen